MCYILFMYNRILCCHNLNFSKHYSLIHSSKGSVQNHWFIQERRVTSQWSIYSIDSYKTLIHSGKTSYESVIRLLNRFVQNHWFIQERRVTSQWSDYSIDSFKTLIHSGKMSYESVIRLLNRFVQNTDSFRKDELRVSDPFTQSIRSKHWFIQERRVTSQWSVYSIDSFKITDSFRKDELRVSDPFTQSIHSKHWFIQERRVTSQWSVYSIDSFKTLIHSGKTSYESVIRLLNRFVQNTDSFRKDELRVSDPFTQSIRSKHWFIQERRVTSQWSVYSIDSFKTLIHSGKTSYESVIRLLNRFVQNTDSFRKDELRVSNPFTQSIRSKHWFIQERRVTSQWSVYSIDSFKITDSFRKDELRVSDPFTQSIRSKSLIHSGKTSYESVISLLNRFVQNTDSFRKDELRVSDPFTQSIRSKHWFIQERRVTSQWSVYSIDSFKTLIHSGKTSYESVIRLLNRFVQNTDSFRKDELRVSDPFTQSIRSKHWFIQERRVTSQWSVYSIDSFKTLIHSGKTSYESVIRLLNRFVQNTDSFRKDELRVSDPFTQSIRSKHWFIQERRVTSQWSVYSIDSFKTLIHSGKTSYESVIRLLNRFVQNTDSFRKDELRVSDPFTQSIRSKHWFIQERRVTSQWSVYSIDSFKTLIHSGKTSYESVIRLLNRFVQNTDSFRKDELRVSDPFTQSIRSKHWFIQERRVTSQWSVYSIDSFKTLIHSGKTSYESVIRLLNRFVQNTDSFRKDELRVSDPFTQSIRSKSLIHSGKTSYESVISLLNRFVQNTDSFRKDELRVSDPFTQSIRSKHWFIQERRVTSQWSVYSIDSFKTLIHSGKTSYESVIRLLNRFVQNTDSFRKDELRVSDPVYSIDSFKTLIHSGKTSYESVIRLLNRFVQNTDSFRKDELRVSDPFTQSIRSKHWFIQERRVTSQWSVYSIDSFKTLIHSGKTSYESVIRLLNRFVQNTDSFRKDELRVSDPFTQSIRSKHWFIQERRVTSQWSVYSIDSFKTLIHSGKTSYESVIRLLNRFVQNTDSFRKDELRVSDPFTQSIRSKHWFIQERRVTSQWSVYSIDSFKTLIHSGKTSYESVIRLLNRFVQNTDSLSAVCLHPNMHTIHPICPK